MRRVVGVLGEVEQLKRSPCVSGRRVRVALKRMETRVRPVDARAEDRVSRVGGLLQRPLEEPLGLAESVVVDERVCEQHREPNRLDGVVALLGRPRATRGRSRSPRPCCRASRRHGRACPPSRGGPGARRARCFELLPVGRSRRADCRRGMRAGLALRGRGRAPRTPLRARARPGTSSRPVPTHRAASRARPRAGLRSRPLAPCRWPDSPR